MIEPEAKETVGLEDATGLFEGKGARGAACAGSIEAASTETCGGTVESNATSCSGTESLGFYSTKIDGAR